VTAELDDSTESLVALLHNIDIVICSMSPAALKLQIPLIDAAVAAGVKRFLPCNWGTPSTRGILALRDVKEEVHDHVFRHRLGFTIVDTGFWYQASIPRVPSGAFDYTIFMPANEVYAEGSTPNMLIDARDIGKILVRILKDERTLNKRVIAYGAVLSQNEIHEIIEKRTGEKLDLKKVWPCSRGRRTSTDLMRYRLVTKKLLLNVKSAERPLKPNQSNGRIDSSWLQHNTPSPSTCEETTRQKTPDTWDTLMRKTCIPTSGMSAMTSSWMILWLER
jgi:hypothetical protein